MHALYVLLPTLCILAIAYRYYSAFIAARVMVAGRLADHAGAYPNDGHNYHPTHRLVLFGHHFAAITGAGPLIGPVLAAQFGYAPGLIWLVAGVCLAGAVHDYIILWASVRRGGRSLAEIARSEIGPVAGITAAVAILFIIVIALAGLGLAVVNALHESAWGTFTIGVSIPLALFMGLYMYRFRKGGSRRRRSSASSAWCSPSCSASRSRRPRSATGSCCRASSSSSRWPPTASSRRCCRCGCCSARATISART